MNYNDFIEAALKEGADFEQIAADFSKALNEKQKVTEEQEAKKGAREAYVGLLLDSVDAWINEDESDSLAVAADLATFAVAETHEDWTADRLRQFAHDAKEQLDALISLFEMEDQGDPFARVLRKGLDIGNNKSKEEEKKSAAPVGKAENKDAEALLKFLRQLGL